MLKENYDNSYILKGIIKESNDNPLKPNEVTLIQSIINRLNKN